MCGYGLTRFLAERSPASLAIQVFLHDMCNYSIPADPIQIVARLCPEALRVADNKDRLPLHYALERKRPFETIEILLEDFPGVVMIRDE